MEDFEPNFEIEEDFDDINSILYGSDTKQGLDQTIDEQNNENMDQINDENNQRVDKIEDNYLNDKNKNISGDGSDKHLDESKDSDKTKDKSKTLKDINDCNRNHKKEMKSNEKSKQRENLKPSKNDLKEHKTNKNKNKDIFESQRKSNSNRSTKCKSNNSKEVIKSKTKKEIQSHDIRNLFKKSDKSVAKEESSQKFAENTNSLNNSHKEEPKSITSRTKCETNSAQILDSDCQVLDEDSDRYDPEFICDPCIVVLNKYPDHFIHKALDGNIHFDDINSEDSDDSNIQIIDDKNKLMGSQEIAFNDEVLDDSNGMQNIENVFNEINETKNQIKEPFNDSNDFKLSQNSSHGSDKNSTNNLVENELNNETKLEIFYCDSCVYSTNSKFNLILHSGVHKNKPKSNVREQTNANSLSLNKRKAKNSKSIEKKRKSKNKNIKSNSCPSLMDYNNQEVMTETAINQILTNSETTVRQFKCDFCDFVTEEEMDLIFHSLNHSNQTLLTKCQECGQPFTNKYLLEVHRLEKHLETQEIQFKNTILFGCEKCEHFECYSVEESDRHFESHIEWSSSIAECLLCNHILVSDTQFLANHLIWHRMFRCAFNCTFVGPDFQTLENHAKSTHPQNGQPFFCKYCEYSSAVFGALVQHRERDHLIEWTTKFINKCGLCESVFNYDETDNILEHLSSHSINFTYFECKLCYKKYQSLDQFKSHIISEHRITVNDSYHYLKDISNLNQLFVDLRQIKDQNNKIQRNQTNCEELLTATEILENQLSVTDNNQTDLLSNAMSIVFNSEEDITEDTVPTISLPETIDSIPENNYFDSDYLWF